ncbi:unnamed protein product [Pleuronectes platessa]|uniref:Uncharacterized protein n=1 Tax=Pleuronectes platessa TaxID=8262 RepID=A0A9N7Y6G5_PLEPL|nr:unnamed protein product [Pleuronectes platessa]
MVMKKRRIRIQGPEKQREQTLPAITLKAKASSHHIPSTQYTWYSQFTPPWTTYMGGNMSIESDAEGDQVMVPRQSVSMATLMVQLENCVGSCRIRFGDVGPRGAQWSTGADSNTDTEGFSL